MHPQLIARLGLWLSPILNKLPEKLATEIYSNAKRYLMQRFYQQMVAKVMVSKQPRTLWGLKFNLPLMNSAGMFKNGEGYDIVANQGAGAYIGGTSTHNSQMGNTKFGIQHPFLSLPKSHLSLNCLGLPNLGDKYLSQVKITANKQKGCPIGWSLMRGSSYATIEQSMEKLLDSLWLYHDKPEIDFVEINESCPNVSFHEDNDKSGLNLLKNRLQYISDQFLSKRKRHLPVILKLSNDLDIQQLPQTLDLVFLYKFDGINLGNTSTNYTEIKLSNTHEQRLFDYFTQNIGGGVGGKYLNQRSLKLCSTAVEYAKKINPGYEFHVIRSGGISNLQDIIDSNNAGISLNQWYTGYFENYIKYGDGLYAQIFNAI